MCYQWHELRAVFIKLMVVLQHNRTQNYYCKISATAQAKTQNYNIMKTRRNQPEHTQHTHTHIQKGITCFLFLFLFHRPIPHSLHGRAVSKAKWTMKQKKAHTQRSTFTYVRITTRNFMFNFEEENNYFSTSHSHHFGYSISTIHRIVYFVRRLLLIERLPFYFIYPNDSSFIWQ